MFTGFDSCAPAANFVPHRPHFASPFASLTSSTRFFAPQLLQPTTCITHLFRTQFDQSLVAKFSQISVFTTVSQDDKLSSMSLSQVLKALPAFTFEERQLLIRRVIELDEPPLSEADEQIVDSRLAAHRHDPSSSLPLKTLKEHLKSSWRQKTFTCNPKEK
jgi:hypothetical protein